MVVLFIFLVTGIKIWLKCNRIYYQGNQCDIFDCFRPDPNSNSFERPKACMNIGSGSPEFFPLADLKKYKYVVDDTIFFKVVVDTSDL